MTVSVECKAVSHGSEAYKETVGLRNVLLRKPLGLEFSEDDLAKEADSHHLAAYREGQLVACLVLLPKGEGVVKMRQVATAIPWQGKGIGQQLVRFSEEYAQAQGYTKIELHARLTAVSFYDKMQYQKKGGIFEEVSIPHQKMYKLLE